MAKPSKPPQKRPINRPGPPTPSEMPEDLEGQIRQAFAGEIGASTKTAYGNTKAGGSRWSPGDGEYYFTIEQGGELRMSKPKEGKVSFPMFFLPVSITGCDHDQELVGRTFNVPFMLNTFVGDDGNGTIISAQHIKFMCEALFGASTDDLSKDLLKIGRDAVGSEWAVKVTHDKKGYTQYWFNGLVNGIED